MTVWNRVLGRVAGMIDGFAHAEGPPPKSLAPFVRWCLSGAWPVIFFAMAVSVIGGSMEVIGAAFLGRIVDSAASSDPVTYFTDNWWLVLAFAVFFLVVRPITFGITAALNSVAVPPNIYTLVQSRLNRWSLGHSVTFFDNDFAGRIAQKQMQTANALTNIMTEVINAISFALAAVIGSFLLLTFIDLRIAGVLVLWVCLYAVLLSYFLPRIRKKSAARAGARAMVTGQVVDTITNIKTVKLFGHTAHEDDATIEALHSLRNKALEFGYLSTAFRFSLMTVAGLLPVLLILGVVLLWREGAASPGDVAATGTVALRIAQMTGWVSFTLMAIYGNIGEVEDGMRTLTPDHDLTDAVDAAELPRVAGRIAFENVTFAYGREIGGVTDLTLTIEPGEKLGIVGASGAGKSTLVALLLRLYDTEEGAVTLDGQDVRGVSQDSLRRQISMVTQETAMFNRSAYDNILYGRPEASKAELLSAAARAEAHGFIQDLEDSSGRKGYEAHLGERGVKLSGGQRQRIALARAFLKDAPVLVLDEATSALDSEVEAAIQSTLTDVMEGKTVIAIAHRLSTISQMDRIIVLDQGRVVEDGNHEALLAENGLYARYWNRQSGGFIGIQEAAE